MLDAIKSAVVRDLLPMNQRPLVIARPAELVKDVAERMHKENVLSVPVYKSDDAEDAACAGFFDVHDLVVCLLQEQPDKLAQLTVGAALNRSKMDVFLPVAPDTGLYPLTELFSRGVHRVPVMDADGQLVSVVSQSLLLKFLAQVTGDAKESWLEQSVRDAGIEGRGGAPEMVAGSERLEEALRQLGEMGHGAAPVAGADGRLIGTLTAAGMRGGDRRGEGWRERRLAEHVGQGVEEEDRTAVAGPEETIRAVMAKMVQLRAHRTWVLEDGRVTGVVSLGDLVRYIMKMADSAA